MQAPQQSTQAASQGASTKPQFVQQNAPVARIQVNQRTVAVKQRSLAEEFPELPGGPPVVKKEEVKAPVEEPIETVIRGAGRGKNRKKGKLVQEVVKMSGHFF